MLKKTKRILLFIRFKRILNRSFNAWRLYSMRKSIIQQERYSQYKFRQTSKTFFKWLAYAINRKTRKEKRKIFKYRVKALSKILIKSVTRSKRQALIRWKVIDIVSKNNILSQVQKDMQFAGSQMRTMRLILAITKISKVIEVRSKL